MKKIALLAVQARGNKYSLRFTPEGAP